MGFLDKFFPKKEKIEKKKVSEGELETILEKKVSSVWEDSQAGFEPENVQTRTKEILSAINELSSAKEEKEDVHKTLAEISRSARKNICIVTRREIENIKSNNLKDFYLSATKTLEIIGKNNSKYGNRAKILFPSKYSSFWNEVKKLYSLYNTMEETAKRNIQKEERLSKWLEQVREYKNVMSLFDKLVEQKAELEKSRDEAESRLKELDNNLLETRKGKEFQRYKELEKRLEGLNKNMNEIKGNFANMVFESRKALLYYKNKMADSHSKKTVEKILDDKGEFMLSENAMVSAVAVFSEIKKGLDSGKMGLDEKRRKKASDFLSRHGKEHLETLFTRFDGIVKSIEKTRKELESSPAGREIKEIHIEKEKEDEKILETKESLGTLEKKIQNEKEDLEGWKAILSKIKKELES
jgi:hypothetical protein